MTVLAANLSARLLAFILTACLAGCALPSLNRDSPVPVLQFEQVCPDRPEVVSPGISRYVTSRTLVYTAPAEDGPGYPLGRLTDYSGPWLLEGIWEDFQTRFRLCSADGEDCTEGHFQWLRMSAAVQGSGACGTSVWLPLHDFPLERVQDAWRTAAESLPRKNLSELTEEQAGSPASFHFSSGHAIHRPSSALDLHLCPHPRCPKLNPSINILDNRLLVAGSTTSPDGTEWYLVNTGGKSSTVWVVTSQADVRILPRSARLLNMHAKDGAAGFLHCFYLPSHAGTPHLRLPALFSRGTHAICLVDSMGEPLASP